jgi:hypothetical protein
VQKLRDGRSKGFFFPGDYWLLDLWGSRENSSTYLAQRVSTLEMVILEIFPDRDGDDLRHRVVKVMDRSRRSWREMESARDE